jgi:hypothetical protein
MLRYRLRTLLILLAFTPPVLAGAWWTWQGTQVDRLHYVAEEDYIRVYEIRRNGTRVLVREAPIPMVEFDD